MKVYAGINRKGKWKASTDYSKVSKMDNLIETELDQIHDRVYIIKIYYGFDYIYELGKIRDIVTYSKQVFHSASAARKSSIWKNRERVAKKNPEDHIFTEQYIATKEATGEPFTHGDIFMDKFNMSIIGIKLI